MRTIIIIILTFIITSCSTMKNLYLSETRTDIEKYSDFPTETLKEKDIATLPKPVQRYFRYCGYIGKVKMINAKIEWKIFFLKEHQITNGCNWTAINIIRFLNQRELFI